MKIQSLRLTIGRTSRFVSDNEPCVDVNTSGYRRRLDLLKGTEGDGPYTLPWPHYQSRLWQHMFSIDYTQTPTEELVAALLPQRWTGETTTTLVSDLEWTIESEAYLHPFAVSTLVHASVDFNCVLPADDNDKYELLRSLQGATIDLGNSVRFQMRDGLATKALPSLPNTSVNGDPIELRDAGRFVLISGVHSGSGAAVASALAQQFEEKPSPGDCSTLRSEDSWIDVKAQNIGVSFSSEIRGVKRKSACAHGNIATLVAYMENLRSTMNGTANASFKWYRLKAAMMLNSLYRREPLDPFNSVQQSRISELWIRERGIVSTINAATKFEPGVPPIPID